jgi:hypothetical protein
MTDKFVKSIELCEVIDGEGPDYIYMSVSPFADGTRIDLVIGGIYDQKCAASLSKDGLKELINILMDIHAAMRGT